MMHAEMGSTVLWLMLLLGAYHGVNPGMGWLFAVALGMQGAEGECRCKITCANRDWACTGHWQRGDGCCVSRQGAPAPDDSVLGRGPIGWHRNC